MNQEMNNLGKNQYIANVTTGSKHATLSTIFGYPFDFVKGRLQAQPQLYSSSIDCLKKSYRSDDFYHFIKVH